MIESGQVFAAFAPTRESWGLGPLPLVGSALLLVGWSRSLGYADDDAPAPFAAILAETLTHLSPLAFPLSGDTEAAPECASCAPWSTPRLPARHRRRCKLCMTRDAAFACRLFDDGLFNWQLQSQFGLLCAEDAGVEAIAALAPSLDVLIEPGWAQALPLLAHAGVKAILRPGVDGDVAALLASDAGLLSAALETLAQTARLRGVAFALLDEARFSVALTAS